MVCLLLLKWATGRMWLGWTVCVLGEKGRVSVGLVDQAAAASSQLLLQI